LKRKGAERYPGVHGMWFKGHNCFLLIRSEAQLET